ncbi:hypothetical protein ACH46N_17930 [Streptomyces pristinaespiralis]|uniref:Uncharacterized protein n=2 Tax=Streptomyces pristinaespiralis TaxID=38300 RepID=D6X5V9_STRE2|nr:Hypothetical protein SPRI_2372 [Streptomyces pristinaespiralis]EFH30969.1 conserved hypothetical protein [Streptomyces pristinaespiralis ATCC 25486]
MADMEYRGIHQTALTPADAAEFARMLHDAPGPHLGRAPVPVLVHEPDTTPAGRRHALQGVYDAIVARIGEPTLYGGSAQGPSVRWRDGRRTVLLAGDRQQVGLSVHDTLTLEGEERRAFEWRGAWSGGEPYDPAFLPYVWQLDRSGPGERPTSRPGGRPAADLAQFQYGLQLLLAAWVEQLPVQVGTDWASFCLTSAVDRGRQLLVSYSLEDGLQASIDDRDGENGEDRAGTMLARGWQSRDRGWWQTDFADPGPDDAADLAALVVTELCARGTRAPEELRARDVSCKDRGELWLPGLGVRH